MNETSNYLGKVFCHLSSNPLTLVNHDKIKDVIPTSEILESNECFNSFIGIIIENTVLQSEYLIVNGKKVFRVY